MMRSPNNAHETHAVGAVTIVRGVASVLKGLAQRHLEVLCTTLISQGISEYQAMLTSMMAKPTLASGWRTTASCVERTMISSSSNSS
jgi:hypothetical protein